MSSDSDGRHLIAVVVHSALLTGAPRIGLEVAAFLRDEGRDVILISMEAGPILEEAKARGLAVRTVTEELDYSDPDDTIDAFIRILQELQPTLVFCNSLATSLWAVAGRAVGAFVVLHACELRKEMQSLLSRGRLVRNVGLCADALIVAAAKVIDDFIDVVGGVPASVFELGSFVDVADLQLRRGQLAEASWPLGRAFDKKRPTIGMCGLGGVRKGFDRFIDVAQKMADYDFLWVGDCTDGPQMKPYIELARGLSNVFVTGWVENPVPFLSTFDVFLLTSREDPNPIAALEAYAFGVPLVVFTETGETWRHLRGGCFTSFGDFDTDVAVACIERIVKDGVIGTHRLPDELARSAVLESLSKFLEGVMRTAENRVALQR